MLKKRILSSMIVIFFILLMPNVTLAKNVIVDQSNLENGVISINWNGKTDNMKVLIIKGKERVNYDLIPNGTYPLQFGDGEYNVMVLRNIEEDRYKPVEKQKVTLELEDKNAVFLQSTNMLNWNDGMDAIKKAEELTRNLITDEQKLEAVYNYVTKNIKYDYKKINTIQAGYIPSIDTILEDGSGICYDYSVLAGSMLRSLDIPTKLIMGYNNDIKKYHAWNEVYINGKWEIVDMTYDAAYMQRNKKIDMFKIANDYEVIRIY